MAGEGGVHGRAMVLPARGTALCIGEEEGDGTGRPVGHNGLQGGALVPSYCRTDVNRQQLSSAPYYRLVRATPCPGISIGFRCTRDHRSLCRAGLMFLNGSLLWGWQCGGGEPL